MGFALFCVVTLLHCFDFINYSDTTTATATTTLLVINNLQIKTNDNNGSVLIVI